VETILVRVSRRMGRTIAEKTTMRPARNTRASTSRLD
jgi:hypothetical protein